MASPWLRPEKADWSHFFFTVNPGHVDIIRQWDIHRGNRNPALCTVQFLVYSDCVWDHFFHVGLTGAALQYRNIHLGLLTSKAESLLAPRTIRWWQRERSSWKMFSVRRHSALLKLKTPKYSPRVAAHWGATLAVKGFLSVCIHAVTVRLA